MEVLRQIKYLKQSVVQLDRATAIQAVGQALSLVNL